MHAAGTAAQEATGDLEVWRAVFAAFQDADDVLSAPALGFAHEHALHALRPGPPLHLQHHPGSGVFEAAGQACTPAQVPAPPAQRFTHRRSEANGEQLQRPVTNPPSMAERGYSLWLCPPAGSSAQLVLVPDALCT